MSSTLARCCVVFTAASLLLTASTSGRGQQASPTSYQIHRDAIRGRVTTDSGKVTRPVNGLSVNEGVVD
jgi:hypothetical protein